MLGADLFISWTHLQQFSRFSLNDLFWNIIILWEWSLANKLNTIVVSYALDWTFALHGTQFSWKTVFLTQISLCSLQLHVLTIL
jgi:hypothetical protein